MRFGSHDSERGSSKSNIVGLTKTELAYQEIRQQIVEGLLIPGAVLDQEALAVRLGLSTTPVREALRLLESEDLVINRRHRNTVVAPLDYEMVEETYTVRLVLDPLAVAMAATRATNEDRQTILDLSRHEDPEPVTNLHHNRRLHRAIYAASGNSVLIQILDTLWDRSDRYRMLTLSKYHTEGHVVHKEHHEIANAVIAGEAEMASDLMRKHISASVDRIRSAIEST